MSQPDILSQFKTIATRINHKSFDHVTRESVITELGIDSLSTMQIIGELETEFNIMIPDEDLVEMVTVGDLCKKIETRLLAPHRHQTERNAMETRLEERLYREYISFFEKAERDRRWNVFNDIPWDKVNPEASENLAFCAETFCSVEMYLPDYVAGGINLVRKYFGQAWFQANWAYEESKHSLALTHWLVRSGKRTEGQMFDLQNQILEKQWSLPFSTPRQMTFYGCVQEMATFVIYCKHREMARTEGDEALWQVYDFVARDEIAHCRFYQGVVKILLEEDREGMLADMAHVFANFQMPGVGLVPDYDERILKMREAGIDRTVFIQKVYIPILKYLGVTRHEMLRAQGKAIEAKHTSTSGLTNGETAASAAALAGE
jgi:acyl-[acyl-carrier-protein] desaturase